MSRVEPTYTRCGLCRGTLKAPGLEGYVECPCNRSTTPGYAATGLTMAQVERLADAERALAGDPGLPLERRQQIVLGLIRKSGVAAAGIMREFGEAAKKAADRAAAKAAGAAK